MTTEVATIPEEGFRPVMLGGGVIVKTTWLLLTPPAVVTSTRSFPVGAPAGTGTEILVALQLVGVATTPLNLTKPAPCDAPKFVPVIVTGVPAGPDVGLKSEMFGGGPTVKFTPLLASPPTVTTTFPFVAPVGTGATMLVTLQLVGVAMVPLKVTVLVPCVAPKFVPKMVTEVPASPKVGLRDEMLGGTTVKLIPLLATPPTVTTTFPVVAPLGTGAKMLVLLQLVGPAIVPLNATVLAPCAAPKFVPVIVTTVVAGPEVGLKLEMFCGGRVKMTPLLGMPFTVTTTLPVVAAAGTCTEMPVVLQNVGVADVPLKVTVLVPCADPKLVPVIVTCVPTGPEVGLRLVMLGGGMTVKMTPLLARPLMMTTTLPVTADVGTETVMLVGLQLVGVATAPLKLTVLVPWADPKLVPVIVTCVPTGPEAGFRLVMLGVGMTAKVTLLLATPPTVTTTLPDVAPAGTGTEMLVALQLVGVAVVPLNLTVLVPCEAPKLDPVMVTELPTGPDVGFRLAMFGTGLPPLTAARKATICMIHNWTWSNVAVAL